MSSHLGEVITLQFGNYANWTGAHFWNFQVRPVAFVVASSTVFFFFFFFPFADTRALALSDLAS